MTKCNNFLCDNNVEIDGEHCKVCNDVKEARLTALEEKVKEIMEK